MLNLTEPAVKTRLHRARLQMAALLEEQAPAAVQPLAARRPEGATPARAAGALHVTAQTALAA
jgi:hypothetical protein